MVHINHENYKHQQFFAVLNYKDNKSYGHITRGFIAERQQVRIQSIGGNPN